MINRLSEIIDVLSNENQKKLTECIEKIRYGKGSNVIEEGKQCKHLFFIEKGLLRTFIINEKENEYNIEFTQEGQFITAIPSLYFGSPSDVTIQALEESEIYRIERDKLNSLYNEFPEMNKLGRIVTEEYFARREVWHAQKAMYEGANRYKNLLENSPELIQRIPLRHLASYLGMSKEHLSRLRAGL